MTTQIELTADDLRAEIGNEVATFGTLVEVDEVQEMAIFESGGEKKSRPIDTVEYKLNNEDDDKDDARTMDDSLSQLPDVADYGFAATGDGAISVTLDPDADLSDAAELREIGERFGYRTVLSGEFENGATEWRLEVLD